MRRYATLFGLAALCGLLTAYLRTAERRHPAPAGPERLLAGILTPEGDVVGTAAADAGGYPEGRNRLHLVIEQRAAGQAPRLLSLRRYQPPENAKNPAGAVTWVIEMPNARADPALGEELYANLLAATVRRRLAGARRDAGRYGLAREGARLRLSLPGPHTIYFGDDADGGLVYAARDEEPDVLLVDHALYDQLARDRMAWVRKDLFGRDLPAHLARLRLGAITLERRPSSWTWSQGGKPGGRARTARVDDVLAAIRGIRATQVLPPGGSLPSVPETFDGPAGPDAPRTLEADGVNVFLLGACPGDPAAVLALRRDDFQRLCFARAAIARATPSASDLREDHLLPFPASSINRIAIGEGARTFVLERGAGGWKTGDQIADPQEVRAYLADLAAERGDALATPAPAGPPLARMALNTAEGDEVTLRLWRPDVVRRDEEPPARVSAAMLALLRADALRFLDKQVLAVPGHDIKKLTLTHLQGPLSGTREEAAPGADARPGTPAGEGWVLRTPVSAPADAGHMARLLALLADLRVQRWVERGPLPHPAARLQVDAMGPTLLLSAAPACLVQVQREGGGAPAGELDPAACADLAAPLASRVLLLLDDARLQSVRLLAPGRPARTLDRAAVLSSPLLATLHGLSEARPEIASYGPPRGTPLLTLEVEQSPPPAGAAPLSTVAPAHQGLAFYPGGLVSVTGRQVAYRAPEGVLTALKEAAP